MRKNIFMVLAAAAALFAFTACKEEVADQISVSSAQIVAPASGDSQTISFNSNVAWEMTSSADWVTVSPDKGDAGDAKVTVTIAPNSSYDGRTATLTLKAGTQSAKWDVKQGFVEVFGAASEINLSSDAQVIEVAVTANQSFTTNTDVDWLTVVATKAAPTTKTVTVSVKANASIEARTGNVFIQAADGSESAFKVCQAASENAMSLTSIKYMGNSAYPYAGQPTDVEEYALVFATSKGNVVLAVNTENGTLAGSYDVDGGADHADGTFSIKPSVGFAKYYTTIIADEEEILVADGVIEISEDGDGIEVTATLMDTKENIRTYTYSGAKTEVVKDNVGASSYISYGGDYNTHFAKQQKQYSVTLHVSDCAPEGTPSFYSLEFNLNADAKYDGKTLPTGKFELCTDDDVVVIDSKYANGLNSYPDNSFSASEYCYANYVPAASEDEWESYDQYVEKSGYVEISEGADEDLYNFVVNVVLQKWYYDDDWNVVYGDEVTYSQTFENVYCPINDTHQEVIEDVDQEFTYAFPQADYVGFWYGDVYGNGGNVFLAGWSGGVNGLFSVQLVFQSDEPYEYVKNYSNRFCNTPMPDGEYVVSLDSPSDAEGKPFKCIANVTQRSYKAVRNSYTGTTAYIQSGSVSFKDGKVSFNLTCKTDDGLELHYTGGFTTKCSYFQDYSAKAAQKKFVAWETK